MRILTITAPLAAAAFLATSAHAGLFMLHPASGHPHLNGTGNWIDEWTNGSTSGWFEITDGRTIDIKQPNPGSSVTLGWDTPIPVNVTNVNWSVKAYGANPNGDGNNRICSFTSGGVFSNCGATVLILPSAPSASQVLVPTDGTAYSQSTLKSFCDFGGFCGVSSTLWQVKVTQP